LLRRIAAREVEAMGELYDQLSAPLFSLAVQMLADSSEAEEVIQDVFVQIWEKAATFDLTLGTPFHWAISITRHRAIDRLRSRKRRARLLEEAQTYAEPELDSAAKAASAALTEDESGAVRLALQKLPAEQRQPIEMAFFGGLAHQEVAEALDQPLGTIKARIRRGLMKLREVLRDYA
jgi:RNA polymerase sigma-70 factor (ECF subfamily)